MKARYARPDFSDGCNDDGPPVGVVDIAIVTFDIFQLWRHWSNERIEIKRCFVHEFDWFESTEYYVMRALRDYVFGDVDEDAEPQNLVDGCSRYLMRGAFETVYLGPSDSSFYAEGEYDLEIVKIELIPIPGGRSGRGRRFYDATGKAVYLR